ncbi:amidohydrolase [Nocardia seriolae]|uniref:Cytosine deaminase n=1 Tax=Nocardia seriolae TaxID=37332 RepID=A0A0B8NGF2_9NOCA|nr:amidohydrolase [Nocardia seriolae]APA99654.1 Cytosine deaminase [Nocardia seriolae]MTJ64222.1 amidohydrolase family protein [Nocardia seriolae]MTJ73897.1 amidohydrolase family protein [Nocardia seriolae]MTJ89215.1 amidohydrolase family protein [Nocardia seriolae]MTK33193.1 amidohydrolase family protein [Nocardia seriolae]
MNDLLLTGGRPWTPGNPVTPADILIRDGRIAAITPGLTADGMPSVDLAGALVFPGLVDAHCHLDKTMYGGPWVPNTGGRTLAGRIANGEGRRDELGLPSLHYASNLLGAMVSGGTAHVRSHIDIDPEIGLRGVEAVRTAAARHADRVDVQLVAFPQGGLLSRTGTAKLLEAALAEGVEVIGGLDPAGVDGDPVGQLDLLFGLAEKYGVGIDIHLHDRGALGAWQYDLIVARTRATGLSGRVTISHAYAMGELPADEQRRIAESLAEAGVSMVTCAVGDAPVVPVRVMAAAGARLALGNDGIRDLWTPYGDGDMLRRIMQVALRDRLVADPEIESALPAGTYGGAAVLGVGDYGLTVGSNADLFAVPAETPAAAVVSVPPRSLVVKRGRVVARDGHLLAD